MTSIAPYTVGADSISARSVRRIAAKILAYRRNFCYNTKAACFTTDGKALHTTAGGWPHFPEGDEADAIYRNVPYRPQDRDAKFRGKKQEPPPWPVTVLN